VVLASLTDVGQLKGCAVPRGLRSLLRRTRSCRGRRCTAPSFAGVLIAVLLAPGSSWAQPPPGPDPPPPGVHGSPPTRLKPDGPPARARTTVSPAPPAPIQKTVAAPPADETIVRPPVEETADPTPDTRARQTTPQPPIRVFRKADLARRQPARLEEPARRAPQAAAAIHSLSGDPDSRPYVLAALSLAVLALGSGTLLTVLSRLRSSGQGLA
jgi:hypothetical protein